MGISFFRAKSASFKTRIPVQRIGGTSFIHSVSTNQVRLLLRGGRQCEYLFTLFLYPYSF